MINEHEKEKQVFYAFEKKNPLKSQLFANSWQTNTFFLLITEVKVKTAHSKRQQQLFYIYHKTRMYMYNMESYEFEQFRSLNSSMKKIC